MTFSGVFKESAAKNMTFSGVFKKSTAKRSCSIAAFLWKAPLKVLFFSDASGNCVAKGHVSSVSGKSATKGHVL
ncbi:hypothetical protein J1N35_044149 [Gossypium stocksii]|uniref:Uncharacterized protein n=1 Tax=Gossypium stocksii TaxID=47602 RepID=A0A9D3U8Y1_9ROSI|nr:hypothetical protein J1N35_044149 [Gossypium stocksii]